MIHPLKSYLTLIDGAQSTYILDDAFLVSVFCGDGVEDCQMQEIENSMEELGVSDDEIDPDAPDDPRLG